MRINYNASAMRANNALNIADKKVSSSLQRLSSGLKINGAKDNPSGYAIGRRMNTQITGVGIATSNAHTGISIIETADGALTEVHEMLQRMNELAVKGATGTLTSVDRATLQQEVKQLKEEISRVARDTEFNGQTLLDGSFELKGYTDNLDVKVAYYSDEVVDKVYSITALTVIFDNDGNVDLDATQATFTPSDDFPKGVKISEVNGNTITITNDRGFELSLDVARKPQYDGNGNAISYDPVTLDGLEIDVTGIGAMDMQIGANEGQLLEIRIPTISLKRLGIEDTDLSTQESSDKGIAEIKKAILYVSDVRSRLGAYQNRLEHTVNSLDITNENMTSSYSNIMDVDMAEEMTAYTTQQVISQAAVSMVAQMNERPSMVLQLLQ